MPSEADGRPFLKEGINLDPEEVSKIKKEWRGTLACWPINQKAQRDDKPLSFFLFYNCDNFINSYLISHSILLPR